MVARFVLQRDAADVQQGGDCVVSSMGFPDVCGLRIGRCHTGSEAGMRRPIRPSLPAVKLSGNSLNSQFGRLDGILSILDGRRDIVSSAVVGACLELVAARQKPSGRRQGWMLVCQARELRPDTAMCLCHPPGELKD